MVDISRTVLQRSELKSRITLSYEQYGPWNFVLLQDVMIQHRGGKL